MVFKTRYHKFLCFLDFPGKSLYTNKQEVIVVFEKCIAQAEQFRELGIPGYNLVIYKDGKQVLRHSGGYSDLENKIPMQGDEVFDIYSCSKLLTCTAALQLWEQGKFRLTDKLSDYLPEFEEMTVRLEDGTVAPAKNPITIEHLFTMTAGFSYDVFSPAVKACQSATDGKCPAREFMKHLAKEPLLFEPGDQYKYSLCHDVLAVVVEVISSEKFEDYVQKHIFDPVGMTHSAFLPRPIACKYQYNSTLQKVVPVTGNAYRIGTEYASGGAGAVSTLDDFVAFLEALRTDKLLKPETLKMMTTNHLSDYQKRTFPVQGRGYGLGVRTPIDGNPHREFGWGGAAGAFASVDKEHGLTLFYIQHVLASPINAMRRRLYELAFDEITGMDTTTKTQNEAEKNITY